MFTFSLEGRITRNPSVLKYQKSLSFLSGPPMSPPHWLAFENGFGLPAAWDKYDSALNELPFQ